MKTCSTRLRALCGVFVTALATSIMIVVPAGATQALVSPAASGSTTIDPFSDPITRLAGDDRYLTAVEVSKRYSPGVPVVFVATGEDFPDALPASAAAAVLGGPLLLTPTARLTPEVRAEIQRLDPEKIYVIGGTSVVSKTVLNDLKSIQPATERLSGADRYATGLDVISTAFTSSTEAIIATGRSFPDALAATGAAGARQAPVVLVDGAASTVSAATLSELDRLGVSKVTIAGGTGAVSAGIESDLRRRSFDVTRYGGKSRYATAALINDAFFGAAPAPTTVFLAAGDNFPDALSAAAIAGHLGSPLYTTERPCTPSAIHTSIAGLGAPQLVVMGGASVISDEAAANTRCVSEVKVMTYNLCGQDKCLAGAPQMEKWSVRKPFAGALVRSASADIIATQESHYKDTKFGRELPGFGLAEYYSAKSLFYRKSKVALMRSGIITLNSKERKYAVWAEFLDIKTRVRFIVADAHLQSRKGKKYDDMRRDQTNVLISKVAQNNPNDLPVVYAGDYNSNKSNANQSRYPGGYDAPIQVFEDAGIPDSVNTVEGEPINADWNSANQAKNPPLRHSDHVDHIFLDPNIIVKEWAMLLRLDGDNYALPFATDHNPIVADLTVPGD